MKNTLLDNFYTEISSTFAPGEQSNFTCVVRLNPNHPVYKGHFEQFPVAPGVCLIQVVKELLMDKFKTELVMSDGDNIKFLGMINPNQTAEFSIVFSIKTENDRMDVTANYTNDDTVFMKFKGKFRILK